MESAEVVVDNDEGPRPRRGYKRSRKAHNLEGYTEAELKKLSSKDQA